MTEPCFQITRADAVVRLAGDFDITSRDELRSTLVETVHEAGPAEVVIDFDEAAFLDSEAMSALIEGLNAARAAGVRMRIVNAHGVVHRVLDVSGVLSLFDD